MAPELLERMARFAEKTTFQKIFAWARQRVEIESKIPPHLDAGIAAKWVCGCLCVFSCWGLQVLSELPDGDRGPDISRAPVPTGFSALGTGARQISGPRSLAKFHVNSHLNRSSIPRISMPGSALSSHKPAENISCTCTMQQDLHWCTVLVLQS